MDHSQNTLISLSPTWRRDLEINGSRNFESSVSANATSSEDGQYSPGNCDQQYFSDDHSPVRAEACLTRDGGCYKPAISLAQ